MNTTDSVFKIIIVHEDSITGLLAANLLKRLAARLKRLLGTDINPWQVCNRVWLFAWLQNPEVWEQAMAEAVAADMIIISAEDHTELPAYVRSWIESALPRKRGGPAVLVALLDGRQETRTVLPAARYLRQLAERHGVDFFCNLDHQPQHVESDIESVLSRFEDDSAFLEEAIPHNHDWRE